MALIGKSGEQSRVNGSHTLSQQLFGFSDPDIFQVAVGRDPFAGGVGVRNVHQRLLLSYGHGLEIESDWEEGTTVTIRIPFQNDEESKEEFL